jgi:hypothetical protein
LARIFDRTPEGSEIKIEKLDDDPAVVSTILQATQAAIRTHQTEKLEALRNAVCNTALQRFPSDDVRSLLLTFVEDFTPTHVQMLKYLKTRSGNTQFTGNREADDQIVNALLQRGLIEDTRPFAARGRPTEGPLHLNMWNITRLGEEFLKLISPRKCPPRRIRRGPESRLVLLQQAIQQRPAFGHAHSQPKIRIHRRVNRSHEIPKARRR